MAAGTEPREAALEILRAVRAGAPFDQALETVAPQLSQADRRLAHEIAAGVLRERSVLDRRIKGVLSKPGKPLGADLNDILRIGTYQVFNLDRVPAYAAVQSAVEVAKSIGGTRSAALVNGVLRSLARGKIGDGGAQPREQDEITALAETYSHPEWLIRRWVARFGREQTEKLLGHNNRVPRLVVQPARWPADRLRSALETSGIAVSDAPQGRGLVLPPCRVRDLPGFREGAFLVQDPAQRRLLEFAAIPRGSRVWDACAAPGGKAAALAGDYRVVSSDPARHRLPRLRENLARVALGVTILVADARKPPIRSNTIDAVLVDAPCSATASMARHPDARWRLTPSRISDLTRLQSDILNGTCQVTRRGGLLVYLTCSLEHEENEAQIDSFLERHPNFERSQEDLFIFPTESGTDGGYGARLERVE